MILQLFMLIRTDEMAWVLPMRHVECLREHDSGAALRLGTRAYHERTRSEPMPLQIDTSAVLTLQCSEYTQAFMHAVRRDTEIRA